MAKNITASCGCIITPDAYVAPCIDHLRLYVDDLAKRRLNESL